MRRDNGYRLGPTAAALRVRALRSSTLRDTAHPELERLAEQTGETATLEVLSEGKMLILDEVLGARLTGASPSLGTAWALHATSTGKAILAAVPTERVAELLPRSLDRFTGKPIADRARLDEAREELEEGYSAAGAVIRTPMLEPYAALSLSGPSARLHPDVLEELGASGQILCGRRLGPSRVRGLAPGLEPLFELAGAPPKSTGVPGRIRSAVCSTSAPTVVAGEIIPRRLECFVVLVEHASVLENRQSLVDNPAPPRSVRGSPCVPSWHAFLPRGLEEGERHDLARCAAAYVFDGELDVERCPRHFIAAIDGSEDKKLLEQY